MEYQEQAESFEGAKTLLAAALATQLANKAIVGDVFKHNQDNPDPLSLIPREQSVNTLTSTQYHKNRIELEKAAETITQRYNPNYTTEANLARAADERLEGGTTTRYTREHIPDLKSDNVWRIKYNPNQDRAIYAHELGHVISQNSEVGDKINKLKFALQRNPKLGDFLDTQMARMPAGVAAALAPVMTSPKVLAAGRLALPTAIAAAIPGDNDAAAAVAANLALASPELLDEFLASKNGFEVLKAAGMPATFKQRARMAGAFGSYLAKPLTAALIGNVAGNVIEDSI